MSIDLYSSPGLLLLQLLFNEQYRIRPVRVTKNHRNDRDSLFDLGIFEMHESFSSI